MSFVLKTWNQLWIQFTGNKTSFCVGVCYRPVKFFKALEDIFAAVLTICDELICVEININLVDINSEAIMIWIVLG